MLKKTIVSIVLLSVVGCLTACRRNPISRIPSEENTQVALQTEASTENTQVTIPTEASTQKTENNDLQETVQTIPTEKKDLNEVEKLPSQSAPAIEDSLKAEQAEPTQHEHKYGSWKKSDAIYHQKECTCGDVLKGEHTWQKDYGKSTDEVKVYSCFCGADKEEIRTEFKYVCYYAEYIIEENNTGKYFSSTEEAVLNGIQKEGGTLVGEVKYSEIVIKEYKGGYFDQDGLYYFLVE